MPHDSAWPTARALGVRRVETPPSNPAKTTGQHQLPQRAGKDSRTRKDEAPATSADLTCGSLAGSKVEDSALCQLLLGMVASGALAAEPHLGELEGFFPNQIHNSPVTSQMATTGANISCKYVLSLSVSGSDPIMLAGSPKLVMLAPWPQGLSCELGN